MHFLGRRDLPLAALAMLVALGIGLLTAWPYFANAGLPSDTDAELHVYRTAELGYSLRAGNLYPRWAPDFFHGYGYPIFNYYAPLTYHLGNWLTLGHPERAAAGARLVAVLALVLGAAGAYRLAKLFTGHGGGLLGALCFAGSPYILLINPHVRGDLPESFALAFVPWALWSWELIWRRGSAAAVLAAVLTTTTAFLSHNLTGLTTVALVAGLGLWRLLVGYDGAPAAAVSADPASGKLPRRHGQRDHLAVAVGAAAIFMLVTAFFWLPFLAERSHIQLDVAGDGHYDFRNHFVPLERLLAWLHPIDRRATAADVPMTAGPAAVAAASGGLIIALGQRRRRDLGFYAVAGAVLFWMVTPGSRWLWEIVPGIEFYQFPWRFLGPLAALLTPLGGAMALPVVPETHSQPNAFWRQAQRAAGILPAVAAGWLLMGALPGLYPLPWEAGFGFISPEAIIEAELEGRWRGTTSTNDFVPETVDMIPGPQPDLLASYRNPPVDRVNRHTLPAGAQVTVVDAAPWVNTFDVTTEQAFTLRLYLFDFPGWQAYVDDIPVEVEIAHPEGFVTVPVPAGDHRVVVRFEATTVRSWSWVVSGVGLVALIAVVIVGRRSAGVAHQQADTSPWSPGELSAVAQVTIVVVLAVVLKVVWLDPSGAMAYTTPIGESPADVTPQVADLAGQVELLGYDVAPDQVAPGELLEVKLVWRATRPLTTTYQAFVHLVYPEGQILGQSDHLNPGGFPTNLWPLDRYIVDRHQIRIPDGAPEGTYLVSVGLFTLDSGARVPISDASCGYRPDSVILCDSILVER